MSRRAAMVVTSQGKPMTASWPMRNNCNGSSVPPRGNSTGFSAWQEKSPSTGGSMETLHITTADNV